MELKDLDVCKAFGRFVCYYVDERDEEVEVEKESEQQTAGDDAAPSALKQMMDAAKKRSENHLPPKDPSNG